MSAVAPVSAPSHHSRVTQASAKRKLPSWLLPTLASVAVVVAAIAIGMYAEAPGPPPGSSGRMLRRVPAPPRDLPTLLYQLGVGSPTWYAAAVALPLMLWGARHVDVTHERRRAVLVAVGTVVCLMVASAVAGYFANYGLSPYRPGFMQYFPVGLRENVLPWLALAGVVIAVEARRRSAHAALERERLRAEVAEQRLIALTGQLHPHFLFNTLQGISTLIHRDAEAADEMLAKLSDLLRDVLRHRNDVLVPIDNELRFVRTYLEIAQLRFADRLTFAIHVAPDVAEASVPLFILQPLVENALSHGIGARALGGCIRVRAWCEANRLLLEVADNGVGLPNGVPTREGIGLSNTRERLRASYGDDQRLTLESGAGGGVVARLDIPYRKHVAATGAGANAAR